MSHVFISYSKKNRAYARKLADTLIARGFDVWIDDRIDYGKSWERVIFEAIDACAVFVVIMTPDSYNSEWVLRECQYAERRAKPPFPVLLEGDEFPRYISTQFVDVRDGRLPPDAFYDLLAQHVPRQTHGENVSKAPADAQAASRLPGGQRPNLLRMLIGLAIAVTLVLFGAALARFASSGSQQTAATETPAAAIEDSTATPTASRMPSRTPKPPPTPIATATRTPPPTQVRATERPPQSGSDLETMRATVLAEIAGLSSDVLNQFGTTRQPSGEDSLQSDENTTSTIVITERLNLGESYTYEFYGCANTPLEITVRALSNDMDPMVELRDSSNAPIATNDDHETLDPTLAETDARIGDFMLPADGNYTIIVRGFQGAAGEFELTVVSCKASL